MTIVARRRVSPWRPVQYLGSKLRSLAAIEEALDVNAGDGVWDAFTGSSVVAQALADAGARVFATDALISSTSFARALLSVGRKSGDDLVSAGSQIIAATRAGGPLSDLWRPWLAMEDHAVTREYGRKLLEIHSMLPQAWALRESAGSLREHLVNVVDESGVGLVGTGLVPAVYAGTYFGLRQSIDLDTLRAAIEDFYPAEGWIRSALLTALCHAASRAVYSPGKHFAQPHRITANKDLSFHARRALQDRSVDIPSVFIEAVKEIAKTARPAGESHEAHNITEDTVTTQTLVDRHIRTVYLDPPYTAQQYSRFYHFLETLTSGVLPGLDRTASQVTRGLYPTGRYLSPYSSRRRAPAAFQDLIGRARTAEASTVISYSASTATSTGNARMVSLDDLIGWLKHAYGPGNVRVRELDHAYRQFNQSGARVTGRSDPEYLIVGAH